MKKIFLIFLFGGILIAGLAFANSQVFKKDKFFANPAFDVAVLKEGDVIFQTSNSGQSWAVQKATDSKYSHVGILFKDNDKWMVYEAVQPVQKVSLEEFIKHGDQKHFTISRFKEKELTDVEISKMKDFFNQVEGKNYDIYFEWSDKTWYCSELVWKMYDHVGIKISEQERFGQYNLEDPSVKKIIDERFKNGVKLDEIVITPRGINESPKMKEIYSNYSQ